MSDFEVKIVRLVSGEEIICQCSIEDDNHELKKPAILIPTGKGTLGLMPWLGYADLEKNTISIPSKFVVFAVAPQVELLNEYNTAFGSGLFVPVSSLSGNTPLPQGSNEPDDLDKALSRQGKKNPALKLSK